MPLTVISKVLTACLARSAFLLAFRGAKILAFVARSR